jgi:diguanylate cyclase (GGDEF)-like protein/PAS domain S-box-containing protein
MKPLIPFLMGSAGNAPRFQFRLRLYTALSFLLTLAVCAAFAAVSWQARALHEQKNAEVIAANQGSVLQERLSHSLSATYALASVLRQGKGKIAGFDALAADMLIQYDGISSLQLARKGVISSVVPLAGNEKALGHDLLKDPRRNKQARLAISTHKLTLAGPFELLQGGVAVIGRLPVFLPDAFGAHSFWGFTTALIRIPDLLTASTLGRLRDAGYDYQLSHLDPDTGRRIVFAGSTAAQLTDPVQRPIEVPNGSWLLSIAPAHGWTEPVSIPKGAGMLLLAAFAALLAYTILRQPILLRRVVAVRTHELAQMNRDLKFEIVQRERAQKAGAQISRLYNLRSHTNGAIVRMAGRRQLLQEICHIAVEHGGFPLAKIALLDGATETWSWVSRYGADVALPECELSRVCTRSESDAAHDARLRVCRSGHADPHNEFYPHPHPDFQAVSPVCPDALAVGFASHVMLQLHSGKRVIGMFSLYAYEANFFDAAQLRLLEDMADDISFALDNIAHEELRKLGEQNLRKLSRAVEQSANAVLITDRDGIIEYINPWFTKITGYSSDEIVGKNPSILKSEATHPETHRRLWDTLLSGKEWHGELHNTKKNGEPYWCLEAISPIKNEAGEVTHFVAITEDISERKQTEQTIQHLAFHDTLTGLPNRRLFRDRLNQAVAAWPRNKVAFALMLLDLDHFKNVNDTLGHDAGDELLKIISERLDGSIRKGDTLARMGGDEFALLALDIVHPEDVAHLAEKLQAILRKPINVLGRELYVSTSMGITIYPDDSHDVDGLIKNADIALYRAKDLGRDKFQFFTDDMNVAMLQRLNLENSMRSAIERSQFILLYQPQVDLASGQFRCVEALIRWRHPELGMVAPDQFIPLAEETGMIGAIGTWVLRTACTQARAWELAGMPMRVAVNLSARQFRQGDLANEIENILRETDLASSLLEIEITEGTLMQDTVQNSATLDTLHRMGLQISIDDFGTGYSSLSYLKRLPIDILKIDQSFVRDIHIDPDDQIIVTAVIALAHSLRLKVVAEGVETEGQLAFLRTQSCDSMQGFLYSGPVPADEVLALYQSGKRLAP